jgi:hypothetical protein
MIEQAKNQSPGVTRNLIYNDFVIRDSYAICAEIFGKDNPFGSETSIRNAMDAFAKLESMSFWDRVYFRDTKFDVDKAANHFNQRTLLKVLGLALILYQEQPLTVRSAFYRAVSAGLFSDTSDSHYSVLRQHHSEAAPAGIDRLELHRR